MKGKSFKSAFYLWIKSQPCIACGWVPNEVNKCEADHVSLPVDVGKVRSHKGYFAYACLPLCRSCHKKRHGMKEDEFYESVGVSIYGALSTYLAKFLYSVEEGYLEEYEEINF